MLFVFFVKQKTAYEMRISDWSSDVCSSDLSAIADFDDEACRAAIGDGPILIHGGGNMGTLWPKHEAFRLHLLRTHRGHPIVQMPQSIHYADPAAAAEMAEAIRGDRKSTRLNSSHSCASRMPSSACKKKHKK